MNVANNKILITGGATGIGLGLTERFVQENNTVIICGRREEALNEVARQFPNVITIVCDLAIEAERIDLYTWVAENHGDLNVLINNAGIQNWMSLSDGDFYQKATDEITINTLAPVHLTTLFTGLNSLQEAKTLLRQTDWPVAEVGYVLGFDDLAHFSNYFKKQTSLTPLAFRT